MNLNLLERLFNKIIEEYRTTANQIKLEILFDLLIDELNNNTNIDVSKLDCFDATILNYDNFMDYYNSEIL